MYQLNPASLDSDNKPSESLYKKSSSRTYKNKKVMFENTTNLNSNDSDENKHKIKNVSKLISSIHDKNNDDEDNQLFDIGNYYNNNNNNNTSVTNENIVQSELNKMLNNNDNENNNNNLQNPSLGSLSNFNDSYKNNLDFLSNNLSSINSNTNNNHLLNNKDLLSKLDYIIHLLEEQHNEKTNHITEELILYLFLGIFIIFVLDSFARASKYVR
tara:strand:+ start:2143 stop:2784 length:642 start_codon:yes stop_codon:yes gene_type:complete